MRAWRSSSSIPDSIGPFVAQVAGATAAGSRVLVYRLVLADGGHIFPNTPITARWRLVPADRTIEPMVGPPVRRHLRRHPVRLADARGRPRPRSLVRGLRTPSAGGRWRSASKAVREAAAFLGVTESEPIDFFVYADAGAPSTTRSGRAPARTSWGRRISDIRTMFALIAPNDVADAEVARTVPHELTHLVFDTAVRNPYHYPPRWLNEGVATYLSEGYSSWLRTVRRGCRATTGA